MKHNLLAFLTGALVMSAAAFAPTLAHAQGHPVGTPFQTHGLVCDTAAQVREVVLGTRQKAAETVRAINAREGHAACGINTYVISVTAVPDGEVMDEHGDVYGLQPIMLEGGDAGNGVMLPITPLPQWSAFLIKAATPRGKELDI